MAKTKVPALRPIMVRVSNNDEITFVAGHSLRVNSNGTLTVNLGTQKVAVFAKDQWLYATKE